jgi:ketosteroid isomerase-like protein
MDGERLAALMCDDVRFRFGNADVVTGPENVRRFGEVFLSTLRTIRHRILDEWIAGDTAIHRMEVIYTRHDGTELTLPVANIIRVDGERIRDYQVYMDVSPLSG